MRARGPRTQERLSPLPSPPSPLCVFASLRETNNQALPLSPGLKTGGPEARAPRIGSPRFPSLRLGVRPTTTPSRREEIRSRFSIA
jgi:hypothetical protein